MKTYTLEEVQDKLIGPPGTPARDKFEYELQMDIIGNAIKQARKEQHLTQEDLGKLVGVQKAQISKLESGAGNSKIDTILRVFSALKATVKLQIELPNASISLSR
jgi:HTH-type transcriptional regulator / antitoxin HipB